MRTNSHDLCGAVEQKKVLEGQMQVKGKDLSDHITTLQEQLRQLNAEDAARVEALDDIIMQMKKAVLAEWSRLYGDDKQVIVDGFTIDRKANRKPDIKDEQDSNLLIKLECALTPEAKKPYTIKWLQRDLVKAIDAGIVPEDMAVVIIEHSISVTPPKEVSL